MIQSHFSIKRCLISLLSGLIILVNLVIFSASDVTARQQNGIGSTFSIASNLQDRQAQPDIKIISPSPVLTQTGERLTVAEVVTRAIKPLAPNVALTGISHEWQKWNNCGPVTITMNLSYFGRTETQLDSAPFLKPNQDDLNVSPHELAAYAQTLGYEAQARVGGNLTLLKQLLNNNLPVIVEMWLDPDNYGGYGHYRLFTGYNETDRYFIAQDSLNGTNLVVPFAEFDPQWHIFNRTYIVVYPSDQADLVEAILGQYLDETPMLEQALRTALLDLLTDRDNAYAWFNMGTNYARLGKPNSAVFAFDKARQSGLPYRMLWYQFDIFESYLSVGRYQDVINLATQQLRATGGLEELYYYRGLARLALGQDKAALSDFRAALDYNVNFQPAAEALAQWGVSK